MPIVLVILAALGGVAIWRRKSIQRDAQKVSEAARQQMHKMRSGRKDLYAELGKHVYAKSNGDNGVDHDAEIERIIGELAALDAAEEETSAEDGAAAEEEAAV